MSLPRKTLGVIAAGTALALLGSSGAEAVIPPPARAAAPSHRTPEQKVLEHQVLEHQVLAKGGLVGVLSVAYGGGRVYFTDNFAGPLYVNRPGKKKPRVLFKPKAPFTAEGVAHRKGEVVFGMDKNQGMPSAKSFLMRLTTPGKAKKVADLLAFEKAKNPDRKVSYGAQGLDQSCLDQLADVPPELGVLPHHGVVESHPYAVASTRKAYYVADAGANDILRVTRKGKVSVVAVLPPFTRPITAEDVAGDPSTTEDDLPDCLVGHSYVSEPVPTDVEVGPRGRLYVTTLPGGLGLGGPFGSLYRIDPRTKRVRVVMSGLVSPTGIAVTPKGDVFVAQLFPGMIGKIKSGSTTLRPYAQALGAAALAWSRKGLVAALSPGVLSAEDPSAPPPAPTAKVVLYKKKR